MRIRSLLSAASTTVLGWALSAPLSAHHSFAAEFDGTAVVTMRGVITKVERINPHGWIYIDVKSPDGSVANWAVETGAPNAMAKRGFKKGSLPVGKEVVITGFRAKDGSHAINGNKITLPDGSDFLLGTSNTSVPAYQEISGDKNPNTKK